jgi:hypothetical protein
MITDTPHGSFPSKWFVWLGAAILLFSTGLALLLWRASRRSTQTSFITRSMYRK